MARDQNTFAKRQREIEKKRKADEKRARRHAKNHPPDATEDSAETAGEGQPTISPAP